jgi:hypothetical protein
MMRKKICVLSLAFIVVFALYSCRKDRTAIPTPVNCTGILDTVNTWNNNINPNIIGLYCAYAPCHGQGSAQFGVDLSTYQSTVTAFQSQNLLCAVTGSGCILMPNGGRPLDTTLIRQLECWQANGFPK